MPQSRPKPSKGAPKSLAQRAARSTRKPKAAKPAAAAKRPAAATESATVTPGQQMRSAALFAFGIVTIAFLLFVAVLRFSAPKPQNASLVMAQHTVVSADIAGTKAFRDWEARWKTADDYFDQSELALRDSAAIAYADETVPAASALAVPRANRYVWSPDRVLFVDYLATFGERGSSVSVFNLNRDGHVRTLSSCQDGCTFDGAFWTSPTQVVVFGHEEGRRANGTSLCPDARGLGTANCFSRLVLTAYDFGAGKQRTYVSNEHRFSHDPYETDNRQRWLSGFSEDEQKAVGQAPAGEPMVLRGTVIDFAPDSRIVSLALEGGTQRFATLAPTAVLHDASGLLVDDSVIAKGASVEVTAIGSDDFTVTALSLTVLKEAPTAPAVTQGTKLPSR